MTPKQEGSSTRGRTGEDIDEWMHRLSMQAVVHAAAALSEACDAMWNDPYRANRDNANRHQKAICSAQQKLADILKAAPPDEVGPHGGALLRDTPNSPPSQGGDGLREALEKAAAQFRFYEREHGTKANKATGLNNVGDANVAMAKAKTNRQFAEMCEAALRPQPADGGRAEVLENDLAAELYRMVEHFGPWAHDRSMEATPETWAALDRTAVVLHRYEDAIRALLPSPSRKAACP